MNYAKRAIIMAAGTGTRLRPVTLELPKPLVTVNGKRIIDTIIEALYKNGIYEIHVVVGYKKDEFSKLTKEFEGIHLIENPYYDKANNISSLYVAREYLEDTFIIDGDQILSNPEILSPGFLISGYCAAWTDNTNEWLLTLKEGIVTHCSRIGGQNGYQLYGVSLWSAADGQRLKGHLEQEFIKKKHTDIYWDDIALFCYPDDFNLGIREISHSDIKEIDSFDELLELDSSYKTYKPISDERWSTT